MGLRRGMAMSLVLSLCVAAGAKDKKKNLLPKDVLEARTVSVMVDPEAGVDANDPYANRRAREAVEKALAQWGRLLPVPEGSQADLLIVVRKGNGAVAQTTVAGTPVNNGPPAIGQSTGTTSYGSGRVGRAPTSAPADPEWSAAGGGPASTGAGTAATRPHPQLEVGEGRDMFAVYRAGHDPVSSPAVWRYTARDGLQTPDVPAVEAFRKLFVESEKQLAATP